MRKILSILLLLNFLMFIIPISTRKSVARQLTSNMPAEEEDHGTSKRINIQEYGHKLLPTHDFCLSGDLFYLISREKFAHFKVHIPTVDWLETFSPPPDQS